MRHKKPKILTGGSVTVSTDYLKTVEEALSLVVRELIVQVELKRSDVGMIDAVLYGKKVTIIVRK